MPWGRAVTSQSASDAGRAALANLADEVEREWAARAIALGQVDAEALLGLLTADDWLARHTALDGLGRSVTGARLACAPRAAELRRAIEAALTDARPELRAAAEVALGALDGVYVGALDAERAGAAAARARAVLTGDVTALPWPDVAAVFRALCAAPSGVRARAAAGLAERLREEGRERGDAHDEGAGAPAGAPALVLTLAAHDRALEQGERARFAAAAAGLILGFGEDAAERVLTAAARLGPAGPCGALLAAAVTLPPGVERSLMLRAWADALGRDDVLELPRIVPEDALLAALESLALRRVACDMPGAPAALAGFARHPSSAVRAAALSLAESATSPAGGAGADWGAPLLRAMLADADTGLARAAFRALARRAGHGPALYAVWSAAEASERAARLRLLDRSQPWPEFTADLLALVEESRDSDALELLGALGGDARVAARLRGWFDAEVHAIARSRALSADGKDAPEVLAERLLHDGRATELALALVRAEAVAAAAASSGTATPAALADLPAQLLRALVQTMERVHPPGAATRARLPKTLVKLLGERAEGRALLAGLAGLTGSSGPQGAEAARQMPPRVRTELAIALAPHVESAAAGRGVTEPAALAQELCRALVDAVFASESELAVRAVKALGVLPAMEGRPADDARHRALAELLARWAELGAEDVRIALVEVAAPDPRHHRALQAIVDGAADDTVAAAALEAAAAAPRGRSASLAALARFEAAAGLGAAHESAAAARAAAGEASALTVEQALVRREAVLVGFARGAEAGAGALPDDVAARLCVRPLAAARGDLLAALERAPTARAEFRYRGELALGAALAASGRLAAQLAATPDWWRADARFLGALAGAALEREPAAAALLAEAALVAGRGALVPEVGRNPQVERTALAVLRFAAAEAAVLDRLEALTDVPSEPSALAALAAAARRAQSAALELELGLCASELTRELAPEAGSSAGGFAAPQSLDARELTRLLGEHDPLRRVDPAAALRAAVSLFGALGDWAAGGRDDAALAAALGTDEVREATRRSVAAERLVAVLAGARRLSSPR